MKDDFLLKLLDSYAVISVFTSGHCDNNPLLKLLPKKINVNSYF